MLTKLFAPVGSVWRSLRATLSLHGWVWICMVGLLAYGSAIHADFWVGEEWVDGIRDGTSQPGGQRVVPPEQTSSLWVPHFLFSVTRQWIGSHAALFHAWNLLVHLGTSVLMFRFLLAFLPKNRNRSVLAWLASLFFVAHPFASEAVCSVTHSSMVVALFFALATGLLILKFASKGNPWQIFWAVVTSLLAIRSDVHGGLLNLAVLATVALTHGESLSLRWGRLREHHAEFTWLVALVAVVLCWVMAHGILTAQTHGGKPETTGTVTLLTGARTFWQGMSRIACPIGLSAGHWTLLSHSWSDWTALVALAVLFGVVFLLWQKVNRWDNDDYRQWPWAMGVLLLATLLLASFGRTSGLFVEGRYYWAIMPAMVILVKLLHWISSHSIRLAAPLTLLILGVSPTLSRNRCELWKNSTELAETVMDQHPNNLEIVWFWQQLKAKKGKHTDVIATHFAVREKFENILASPSSAAQQPDIGKAYRWLAECERNVMKSMAQNYIPELAGAFARNSILQLTKDAERVNQRRGYTLANSTLRPPPRLPAAIQGAGTSASPPALADEEPTTSIR